MIHEGRTRYFEVSNFGKPRGSPGFPISASLYMMIFHHEKFSLSNAEIWKKLIIHLSSRSKFEIRAAGRSENPGVPVLFGEHNLPSPLVEIGLTDLPKSGGAPPERMPLESTCI